MNIKHAKINDIIRFISGMGNSSKHFRYFSKRQPEVIKNHLATLIGVSEEGYPIAYGHLDPEGTKVWLGICVAESCCGKGLGKQMMNALLEEAQKLGIKEIFLSVDEDNPNAVKLYEKCGFVRQSSKNGILYFIKTNTSWTR